MNLSRLAQIALGMSCIVWATSAHGQSASPAVPTASVSQTPASVGLSEIKPLASPRPRNSSPTYLALRGIAPSGDAFTIEGVTIKRQEGEFNLHKGTVYLYPAVNGHITGAVFLGTGSFHLKPPGASEQKSLAIHLKSNEMNQDVSTVVMRFTDGTAEELRKASTGSAAHLPAADSAAATLVTAFHKKINTNIDSRILQDVLSDKPGGLFLASFHESGLFGKSFLYIVDPQGAPAAAPDEIALATYDENKFEVWTAFHPITPFDPRLHGAAAHITEHTLDTTIEKNGFLRASAITTFTAWHDNTRIVPLNLYGKLRVTGVYGPRGEPLDFIQENEDLDPQFAVLLSEPLGQGKSISIRTDYSGKEVVLPEGEGNYFPSGAARDDWYPNGYEGFGSFSTFRMTFHVPKGLVLVGTGQRISSKDEGAQTVSVWQTDAPIAVAGFNLGAFKESDTKTQSGFGVEAYANTELPDFVRGAANGGLGTLATTPALKHALAEGSASMDIFTNFFGPLSYNHVALTQQTNCFYGQSWPELVYLPICYFWDDTIKQRFGLLDSDRSYWTTVAPHEVSHQWWGHTVGFTSYRDQWMSEGFADFSASLYLLYTQPDMNAYRDYWSTMRHRILDKNPQGVRPIDVGALTMGARLNSEKQGEDIYSKLVYSKGAYVMHMLEMMYWTPEMKEEPLKKSMREFVNTYRGRSATTEEFKASLEKTMPPWMDIDKNKSLDWFFNAYVYGTELPRYTISSEFSQKEGKTFVHLKLTQSNVSDNFHMLVPVYIDLGNGSVTRLFNVPMKANQTIDKTLSLGTLPAMPKRLLLNYNYDLLSDN